MASSYEKQRAKQRAQTAVACAVENGTLVRPARCSRCGSTKDIQAHHPDYSKPLDVEWLCCKCHVGVHRPRRQGEIKMTFRPPLALWRETKILAINKGISAESLVIQALTAYMKGEGR